MMLSYRCLLFLLFILHQTLDAQTGFFPTNDGTQLYYSISGHGRDTLILLHGGPGQNSHGVAPDLMRLSKKHVFITYDQRGSGLSEIGDTTKMSATTHVQDLEDLRKFFHIEKMTLVGHSWGCMLAVLYTSKNPDHVASLLLLSPGPAIKKQFQQRFAAFLRIDSTNQARVAQLRSQLETSNDPLGVCREIAELNERLYFANPKKILKRKGDYCNIPAEAVSKQAITARLTLKSLSEWILVPILRSIRQPVLIIEGKQTPVPMEELNTWTAALPNDKLLLINKVGHAYPFVEQPRVFFRAVERFLKAD